MQAIKRFWSLWRYAIPSGINVIISITCYAIGWHLSDQASGVPLTRAAAAATVFSIGFTLYDYRQVLETSERATAEKFKRVTDNLPITGPKSQEAVEEKLKRNTTQVVKVVRVVDSVALMLATFVWGFGDLANRWM
ncbi:hypothetical protein [Herbaspirillum sp. RV1423]|uniref:hypothetical protein n=1 Tax=Herbaspirillum sp. RV1423 TaxID=1443993 RepID=UPI0012DD1B38|nr:hypothetical protein [Herbaspirillum sp. RV1423]